jgi:hypothetical protein
MKSRARPPDVPNDVRPARCSRRVRAGLAVFNLLAAGCVTAEPIFVPVDAGPIMFVQVSAATPQEPLATVAIAFSQPQRQGGLNVIAVGWNDLTSVVVSVTDSSGNPYVLAVGPTRGTIVSQSIYYAANIHAAASNTVTVTFDQPAAVVDLRATEYAGLRGVVGGTAASTGMAPEASAGALDVSDAPALIVLAGITSWEFTGAGANYAVRIITRPDTDIAADQLVYQPGSYPVTAQLSLPGDWVLQAVLLR